MGRRYLRERLLTWALRVATVLEEDATFESRFNFIEAGREKPKCDCNADAVDVEDASESILVTLKNQLLKLLRFNLL